MDKFVYYSQFVVITLYVFNTLAYLHLGEGNKTLYWFGAVCLAVAVLRMR